MAVGGLVGSAARNAGVMAALTPHQGGAGEGLLTGRDVLEEICDLLELRLSQLPMDDQVRPGLASLVPQMRAGLGRAPVRVVRPAGGE